MGSNFAVAAEMADLLTRIANFERTEANWCDLAEQVSDWRSEARSILDRRDA